MVKITADSTCDLPMSLLKHYNVGISPLGVVKGDGLFRDNVDITTVDIAAHVDAGGEITTTNAVNIADYYAFFQAQMEDHEALVHISLGSGFSSCYQNASLVTEELKNVTVIDSENLSLGHGVLVLEAAKAAQAGASVADIVALVEALRPKVEVSFVLDTLAYMKKGGRCSAVLALGANLLKLHPCIEVTQGKMVVSKKYRGTFEKVVGQWIQERLTDRQDIDTSIVYFADACNNPDHGALVTAHKTFDQLDLFDAMVESTVGCTVFCHCGPNTIGFAVVRK